MPLKIFKYELTFQGREHWRLPKGAVILSVGAQPSGLQMWALVDPDAEKEGRNFFIAFTGQELPEEIAKAVFIGTAHHHDGFVMHVFELIK